MASKVVIFLGRGKSKLIFSNMHPQEKGVPVTNNKGKYFFKMYFNGTAVMVPVTSNTLISELHSGEVDRYHSVVETREGEQREFWLQVLEKAYYKLRGGYDRDGSEAAVDMNVTFVFTFIFDSLKLGFSLAFERFCRDFFLTCTTSTNRQRSSAQS